MDITPESIPLIICFWIILPFAFTLGFIWGRWKESRRARWIIDLEAIEGGVIVRRVESVE